MKKVIISIFIIAIFLGATFILNYHPESKNSDNQDKEESLISSYHQNLINLQILEAEALTALEAENADDFSKVVKAFEAEAQDAIETLATLDKSTQTATLPFINIAQAKERSSWGYQIPVIGHFVKSYHEAIETKRADAYKYIKDEMDTQSEKELLAKHGIKNVEVFRKMDDDTVNQVINSDPELYSQVKWTKIYANVLKSGVNAYVDSVKGALSGENPITLSGIGENVYKDLVRDGKLDTVKDQMPKVTIKKGNGTVIGMNKDFQKKLEKIIVTEPDANYKTPTDEEDEEILKLLEEDDDIILFGRKLEEEDQEIILPEGDWAISLGTANAVAKTKEIEVEKDQPVVIDPAQFGFDNESVVEMGEEEIKKTENEENSEENLEGQDEVEENDVDYGNLVGTWKAVKLKGENTKTSDYFDYWPMSFTFKKDGTADAVSVNANTGEESVLSFSYDFDGIKKEGKLYIEKDILHSNINLKENQLEISGQMLRASDDHYEIWVLEKQ